MTCRAGVVCDGPVDWTIREGSFEQAKASETAEGWEAFLDKYPKSKLVKPGREHLDETLHALALGAIRARDEQDDARAGLSPQKAALILQVLREPASPHEPG